MKKIYSFIFTLLFKHFLRITAREENKTTWQTNLYYMYFSRKCLYFIHEIKKTPHAGELIMWCFTCDIRVGSSKDVELSPCDKLTNLGKFALLKVLERINLRYWKNSNYLSEGKEIPHKIK